MTLMLSLLVVTLFLYTLQVIANESNHLNGDGNEAKIHYYEFNITSATTTNPDCSNYTPATTTFFINGQIPGPTIYATKNDRIQVLVRNMLPPTLKADPMVALYGAGNTNALSIHYHGIRQYNSNQMDGVPFVTQDPILPGEEYLYDFIPDASGTYFYHAHVGIQESSVFGPLIIYENDQVNPSLKKNQQEDLTLSLGNQPVTYFDDQIITISEWFHKERNRLEASFLAPNFSALSDAESVLINGKTVNNEQVITTNENQDLTCQGYTTLHVQREKTYRFRVIGASTFRSYAFAIQDHPLTIIEADGGLIDPYVVDHLEVQPGQRYSVLVTMNQTKQNDYPIGTLRLFTEEVDPTSNGWALLQYHDQIDATTTHEPVFSMMNKTNALFTNLGQLYWVWDHLKPAGGVSDSIATLPTANRTLFINLTSGPTPDLQTNLKFFINGLAYTEPKKTLLTEVLEGTRQPSPLSIDELDIYHGYDPYLQTYPLRHNELVDIVLQNNHEAGTPCRVHPWHIHGYSHYVLAHGSGTYNETLHGKLRNVPFPVLKDTSPLYPDYAPDDQNIPLPGNPQIGCGWIRIRFLAVSM
ncbi:unnamed protein product [Cunninghamella blakesleeana]